MVPGVVQPDLPAPGGQPMRAADNHVEGLLARTVGRANKRTCDKRERLKLSRKHRRIGFKVKVLQFGHLQGTLDISTAFVTREVNSSWWPGLVAGILELVLGFWAFRQRFPARGALLLLWAGFFALFRGISEIVVGFEFRSRQHG
jgi:hypothetical protein